MLSYYRPRLDVSTLTDDEFVTALANLLRIRQMEKAGSVDEAIKRILDVK